jgi:hypothetical protein
MDMVNWHRIFNEKKIILIYNGPLWSKSMSDIARTFEERIKLEKVPLQISQKVFSVFIEQMNNIFMYSLENEKYILENGEYDEAPKGTIILGREKNKHFIQTGNVMKNEFTNLVKNKLDYLNTLDKSELRKFYKEQLRYGDDNPDSKGAGLGFIEIARRIDSKIEYSFTPYDEGLSYFTFFVSFIEE